MTSKSGPVKTGPTRLGAPPLSLDFQLTAALSRVRSFLPEMERADEELRKCLSDSSKEKLQQRLDIENHEEGEPCIEFVSFMKYIPYAVPYLLKLQ